MSTLQLNLYPWQKECLKAWYNNNHHGIAQVVTGGGKTIFSLFAASMLQKRIPSKTLKVKIVVPRTFMVGQWSKVILDNYDTFGVKKEELGCYYGEMKTSLDKRFMIYVINSARYCLSRHILKDLTDSYPVLLIADECHHYASLENQKIFDFISYSPQLVKNYYFSLGLSATPQIYGFSSILIPSLGPVIYEYGFHKAINENIINNCAIFNVSLPMGSKNWDKYCQLTHKIVIMLKKLKNYLPKENDSIKFFNSLRMLTLNDNTVIAARAVSALAAITKRRAIICEEPSRIDAAQILISKLSPSSKIIVFGDRISQTELLYYRLNKQYPNQVARYHSEMEKGSKNLAMNYYKKNKIRILVTCKALDEGLDIPASDVGIVVSGTSQIRQHTQRFGRILRRDLHKGISSLYYFYLDGTIEECRFFKSSINSNKEFFLSFDCPEQIFSSKIYDKLACKILDKLEMKLQGIENNIKEKQLSYTNNLLKIGRLRSDFLNDEAFLQNKIANGVNTNEKNYWKLTLAVSREWELESK